VPRRSRDAPRPADPAVCLRAVFGPEARGGEVFSLLFFFGEIVRAGLRGRTSGTPEVLPGLRGCAAPRYAPVPLSTGYATVLCGPSGGIASATYPLMVDLFAGAATRRWPRICMSLPAVLRSVGAQYFSAPADLVAGRQRKEQCS